MLTWLWLCSLLMSSWEKKLAEDELGFSWIMAFIYGHFFLKMTLKESTTTIKSALLAVRQMIVSLQVMVALLMSPKDHAVNVIDMHIKLFLSCCHRFCQLYYNDDKVPFWATTSNFPSLLNIAAQIKKIWTHTVVLGGYPWALYPNREEGIGINEEDNIIFCA